MRILKLRECSPGAEPWVGFGRKIGYELAAEAEHFGLNALQKRVSPMAGVNILVKILKFFDHWLLDVYLEGGGGGTALFVLQPKRPEQQLVILTDPAVPGWPPFIDEITYADNYGSSWIYYSTIKGEKIVFGSDSGSQTDINSDGVQYYYNYRVGSWLQWGYHTGIPETSNAYAISIYDSPAYLGAYAAYTALMTQLEQAEFPARWTRAFLTDGTLLGAATTISRPVHTATNLSKEGWSGGPYIQLWSTNEDDWDSLSLGHAGDVLTFELPGDTKAPTAEYGWNSVFPIPAYGVITKTTVTGSDIAGEWIAKVGFYSYPQEAPYHYVYSVTGSGVDRLYTNYPTDLYSTNRFTQMQSGYPDKMTSASVTDFAAAKGIYAGTDPWEVYRKKWTEARAAAPALLDKANRKAQSDALLADLAAHRLPSDIKLGVRTGYPASNTYVAPGNPTLTVTSSVSISDDGLVAVHTRKATFSYSVVNAATGQKETRTVKITGTRTDTVFHAPLMDRFYAYERGSVKYLRQEYKDWCNWNSSAPTQGAAGSQANEPGTTGIPYAYYELGIDRLAPFYVDSGVSGASSDETGLLFPVVNGVRYLVQEMIGMDYPIYTNGTYLGTFPKDKQLPFPIKVYEDYTNHFPDLFIGQPPLTVTAFNGFLQYRAELPLKIGKPRVIDMGEGSGAITDHSFLDSRPPRNTTFRVYVCTTRVMRDDVLEDVGVFPTDEEAQDLSAVACVTAVHEFTYTFATGSITYVRQRLSAAVNLPAYPYGVAGLTTALTVGSPPSDLGTTFANLQTAQRSSFTDSHGDKIGYTDPTVKKRDKDGKPIAWYTHLGEYLNAPVSSESPGFATNEAYDYRMWAITAWYYRQLLALPLESA